MIIQLFGEAIGETSEAAARHAEREVLPFNIAGRDVLVWIAGYYLTLYGNYGSGRVPALRFLYKMHCRSREVGCRRSGGPAKGSGPSRRWRLANIKEAANLRRPYF